MKYFQLLSRLLLRIILAAITTITLLIVLVLAYIVVVGVVFLLRGPIVSLFGNPVVSKITETKYAILDDSLYDDEQLYESRANSFGMIWKRVPGVEIGHTYNGLHPGYDVLISSDSKLLFVRRNTLLKGRYSPHIILSDVIDISTNPPQILVQGPDCCMDGDQSKEALEKNHEKVLRIARAAGLNLDP